jgi:asparagine synthase (glutamine-hydrolysing)
VPPQTRWAKLPALVDAGGDVVALYQLSYALFLPDLQRELRATDGDAGLDHGLTGVLRSRVDAEVAGQPPLAALSRLEQRLFLGERLLRDSDAASMAVSLELRLPLVDHVLTDTVAGLPEPVRFQPVGRKQALRDAGLAGLDPALFAAPKRGFTLPFESWLGRHLGTAMDDTMRDRAAAAAAGLDGAVVARLWDAYRSGAPGLYWSRVWAVYVLMRWCATNGVRA